MALRHRIRVFLLDPPPEAVPTRLGRLRQALLGSKDVEIAALLAPLCRVPAGRAFLLGADGQVRTGMPTAHQRLALASRLVALLLHATLGSRGLLLLGHHADVAAPHLALAWRTPTDGHLVGDVAHQIADAWTPWVPVLGLGRHTAIPTL